MNPWIVAVSVMLATFMEVLDTTVVNAALPHIAGNLSASIDEATCTHRVRGPAYAGSMATSQELVRVYLGDAIAAKKHFETQLRGFAKEGDDNTAQAMFSLHADETRVQHARLTTRLNILRGSTSGLKTMLAHMIGILPKAAQIGHEKEERTVQNLMMAYTVEFSEMAMYEAMATVARQAGDSEAEELARLIQAEERATATRSGRIRRWRRGSRTTASWATMRSAIPGQADGAQEQRRGQRGRQAAETARGVSASGGRVFLSVPRTEVGAPRRCTGDAGAIAYATTARAAAFHFSRFPDRSESIAMQSTMLVD